MQLSKMLFMIFLIITLLIGCSIEKNSIVMSPLPQVENQFIPSIIWSRSVGDGSGKYYSNLSPVYDDSIIYAADRKGTVKAMDVDSGQISWSLNLSKQVGFFLSKLPALISGGLTVAGNKLYFGTETGKIIALNKSDGKIMWIVDVAGEALSRPVVSDSLVLIHTSNGILQALDSQTGQSKWSVNLGTSALSIRGKSAPAVAYGIIIVGSNSGRISAVELTQGQLIWQQCISHISSGATEIDRLHDVNITPIIDVNLGAIFAIAYNGNLVSIDMRSRQIIWKRDLGSVNDIIVTNDTIYLIDQSDRVLAIHKSDGITLWTQDALLHRNLTAPIIYNGYLVLGDGEGYLHWLNTQDGTFIAQKKVNSSGFLSRPVIASDKLLLQAKNGTLHLIKS